MGDIDIFLIFVPQMTNSISDMKKILLFAIGLLTSVTMLAEELPSVPLGDYIFQYDESSQTATLIGANNKLIEKVEFANPITIPDVGEFTVTGIGKGAFKGYDKIRYVIIPENVKSIGENAFNGCSSIRLMEFPSTIIQIGNNAFSGCSSLDYVGCNNTSANSVLQNYLPITNKLMSLFVPVESSGYDNPDYSWKEKFGERIYKGKMKIVHSTDYNMDFVCATGVGAGKQASLYKVYGTVSEILVPSHFKGEDGETYDVFSIGRAFIDSKGTSLEIENGVTTICNSAFENSSLLRKMTLPESMKAIGTNAFKSCNSLSHIWCKVVDPSVLKDYVDGLPKNEMMTLYVANKDTYKNESYPWKALFKERIYQGEMKDTKDSDGNKYIYATDSKEATLFEVVNKNIEKVNFNVSSYTMTGIDRQAFLNCSKITYIEVPEKVTAIGPNAFEKCSGLEEIKLPASLTMIGKDAFSGCSKLVRVESKIPTLFTIDDKLFSNANSNEKILYHKNSSFGSDDEFKGWKNGFTYILKGDKEEIPYTYVDDHGEFVCDMTFTSANESNDAILIKVSKDAEKIEVPNTVGPYAKGVKGIFKDAFIQAPSLDQLTFKEGGYSLTIGKGALNGCSKLRILKLPSRLNKLSSDAFTGSYNLAHVLFKSSASIIVQNVFSEKTRNNAVIYIPSSSNENDFVDIGWNPNNIIRADYLDEFNDKEKGMTYIGWKQESEINGTAKLTKGITGSSEDEFIIPNYAKSANETTYDVIAIADNAFSSIGTVFKNLTISDGIRTIGVNAFKNRTSLQRVILPASLTKIGESAFSGCTNLTGIETISEDVSLNIEEIGASAFYNCTSLEKITLPASLTYIGNSAFAGCSKLTEIESFIESPINIDYTVFPNYSATLYVPSGTKEYYLAANVWKNFGDKNISVGNREEYTYEGLKYVYASCENTATLIKSDPEKNNVEILQNFSPSGTDNIISVTAIAASALKDKSKIVTLKIPEGVTSIGASAFENCTSLNKVELPKSLVLIGDQAFGNCGKIKTIISEIPSGNLSSLTNDIKKVFTSDKYPDVVPLPDNIFIPVGENSKSTYLEKWYIFNNEKYFVEGYPRYNEPDDKFGWFFDYLTTIDEESVSEEDIASTLYGTATIIKATNRGETDGNLIIPEEVSFGGKKYQVTSIGDNAFNEYPDKGSVIKTLSFRENLAEIGKYAFSGFSSVQKIWLPKSLKLIKEKAFNSCNSITHVCSRMEKPTSMSDDLFPSIPTNNTATLFVPGKDGYTSGSWANFSNLVEGKFIDDKTTEDGIVYSCYTTTVQENKAIITKALKNINEVQIKKYVTLVEGSEDQYLVTSIGKYAFQNCTQLMKLELPEKLCEIGAQAFVNSSNIKTIISQVPGIVVKGWGDDITNVFSSPSPTLEKIYVPVNDIEDYRLAWKAFFNLEDSKFIAGYPEYDGKDEKGWLYDYLTVDDKDIDETQNTATLKKTKQSAADENHVLTIPSDVTIGDKKYKVTKISENAFNDYEGKATDIQLIISEGISDIGKNAFKGFTKLEKVWLPKSLESIGENAFYNCGNITHVCSKMENPKAMNDEVFSTPTITATLFVPSMDGYTTTTWNKFPNIVVGEFVIDKPEGDLTYSCYKNKKSVVESEEDPYIRSAILTKSAIGVVEASIKEFVEITEEGEQMSYYVTEIGKNAFQNCSKLTKVELPSNLTSIGKGAFVDCKLDEIVSDIKGANLRPIPEDVFSEYTITNTNAKVYVPDYSSIDVYKATDGWAVLSNCKWEAGQWKVSGIQNDHMKYKYHTGTYDAIVVEIAFPNDENEKNLNIKRNILIENGGDIPYNVISIAPTGIDNKGKIQTITIEDSAKPLTIGDDAFRGCTNLKKVEFPSSLTAIGNNAFNGDTNLEEVRLEGVITIGDNAFYGCTNLQKLWLPGSLTSIGSKAFNGCNLTRVSCYYMPEISSEVFSKSAYNNAYLFVPQTTMVKGTTGWGEFSRIYEGYYKGEAISSDDKKTYIYLRQIDGSRTAVLTNYNNSDKIKSPVKFNNEDYDVTIIGESSCNVTLDNLELPKTIIEIEKKAFQNKLNLTSLSLPSDLKIIGDNAFSGNSKLESLTFSDKVESIGDNAFKGCSNIKKLIIPASLKTIGDGAFSGNTNLNDLSISEGIETIGDKAFYDCVNLKNVVLPSTLKTIGSTVFDGCNNLTEVISKITDENVIKGNTLSMPYAILYVPNHKDWYDGWNFMHILEGDKQLSDEMDGLKYAYSTGDKKAVLINATKTGDVTIPGSIKIGNINYDVIAIDKAVFKSNTDIKSVVIGQNIETIGANAFQGCSNLKMIELPASIKSIGDDALDGCTGLTEVICKSIDNKFITENVISLPNGTLYITDHKDWYSNAGWNFAHIYEGERKTEEVEGLLYAYSSGADEAILVGISEAAEWTDGKVVIPGSISIGDPAKNYSVIDIADNAFKDNTAIKTVEIGENIQSIGANAFDGCKNLKEIVSKITDASVISGITFSLPDAMLYVPNADLVEIYKASWAFSEYYVGNRLTTEIDGLAYVCATGDKKAVLVSSITEKLGESITIPGSITPEGETEKYTVIGIAENAFSGNTNIVSVMIAENVKTIGANAFQGCSNLSKVWLPASLNEIGEKAFDKCNIAYICTSSKTPLVSPNIINNVFSTYSATLYVPNGTLSSYNNSDVWKTFPIRREGYFKGVKTVNGLTYECLINGEGETAEEVAILTKSETTDKEVEILSSVKLDGNDATSYNVTAISKEAFSGNNSKNNLEKLIIPATLKTIEDKAFEQCTKLSVITSRIAKDNLFTFNDNVFLQTVYDNATVYILNDAETETKYKATDGWKNFKNWAKGEKKIGTIGNMTYEYLKGVGTATLTKAAIDNEKVVVDGTVNIDGEMYTVTAIGANAFKDCKKLKKVWLPSTLISIDATAFAGCTITHVSSQVKDPTLISENVFPTSATLFVPTGKKSDYSNAKFSYVAEGEFVDEVTDNGFTYECLKSNKAILMKYTGSSNDVVIPGSVTLASTSYKVAVIAKPAFSSKTKITSLIIPAEVEEIDDGAFSDCSSLMWIESKRENPISISSNVFANYAATLFIPSDKVTEYENKGWKFLNIFIGDRKETTTSDGRTYVYSTGDKKAILTKVTTNDKDVTVDGTFKIGKDEYKVAAIAESVFKGKTKMESLKISENIENIGANAFQNCTKLEKVEFPATLKKIGSKAFDGCNGLVSLTCEGKDPAEIGADAFPSYNVTVNVPKDAVETYKNNQSWKLFTTILGMTTTVTDDSDGVYTITEDGNGEIWNGMDAEGDFVIQEEVMINGTLVQITAIAEEAFKDVLNLTGVTIPVTVKSIGASAFAGCSNLKSVTVYWNDPIALGVAGARGSMTRSSGSSIFEGVNLNTCILYVPAGCVEKYRNAAVWGDFKNILEIGTTAINGVVISEEGRPFDIYNMQGRKVRDNVTSFDGLPSGVYIVNGKKVMVK